MGPRTPVAQSSELVLQPLCDMLNAKHPLVKLADVIDGEEIERSFGAYFQTTTRRPALSLRLVAGQLYLQHAYDCSDEVTVNTCVENPYVQYFTGETYFQSEAHINSSSLTRWRKRIGEEGVETLLMVSISAARTIRMMKASSVDRVIVDTTVMPKAIAHPTDNRILEKSRQYLVKLATDIALRQNYNREAIRLAAHFGRYAHAKQYRGPHSPSAGGCDCAPGLPECGGSQHTDPEIRAEEGCHKYVAKDDQNAFRH